MCLALDVIVASASGGALVYSGILLAPGARIRVQDIVVQAVVSHERDGIDLGFPDVRFPESDVRDGISQMFDIQVGVVLLVAGTLGGVIATIIGKFAALSCSEMVLTMAIAFAVTGFGTAWGVRRLWQRVHERRVMWIAFLSWLDRELAPWRAKHWDPRLGFAHLARTSQFSLLRESRARHDDDDSLLREVLCRARRYRYRWSTAGIQALLKDMRA